MVPLVAQADRLEADGAIYAGRVISALGGAVIFDFDCAGNIKTFELKLGWSLDITGDCGSEEPYGIGGSEVCGSNKAFGSLYLVQSLPKTGDQEFIAAFDYYSYDGESFYVGNDGQINRVASGAHSIKRIEGDFCAKYFGRELE